MPSINCHSQSEGGVSVVVAAVGFCGTGCAFVVVARGGFGGVGG